MGWFSPDYKDVSEVAVLLPPRPKPTLGDARVLTKGAPFREPAFGSDAFRDQPVRLGVQITALTEAQRNSILDDIDATDAKIVSTIMPFHDAHLYDLADVLGDKLATWNQWWTIMDLKQPAVFNLSQKLISDDPGMWTWSSEEEGAFSSWKYGAEQLIFLIQSLGVPVPPPPQQQPPPPQQQPPPPGGQQQPPAASSNNTIYYVGAGVLGLGVLGTIIYALARKRAS